MRFGSRKERLMVQGSHYPESGALSHPSPRRASEAQHTGPNQQNQPQPQPLDAAGVFVHTSRVTTISI